MTVHIEARHCEERSNPLHNQHRLSNQQQKYEIRWLYIFANKQAPHSPIHRSNVRLKEENVSTSKQRIQQ